MPVSAVVTRNLTRLAVVIAVLICAACTRKKSSSTTTLGFHTPIFTLKLADGTEQAGELHGRFTMSGGSKTVAYGFFLPGSYPEGARETIGLVRGEEWGPDGFTLTMLEGTQFKCASIPDRIIIFRPDGSHFQSDQTLTKDDVSRFGDEKIQVKLKNAKAMTLDEVFSLLRTP